MGSWITECAATTKLAPPVSSTHPARCSRVRRGRGRNDPEKWVPAFPSAWNRLRANRNFLNRFNLIWVVQSPRKKYFASPRTQITSDPKPSRSPLRGALRDRHERWARDAVDAAVSLDERHLLRTAKSCGPDIPTLVSSLQLTICKRRWQTSPVTGESAKETVKTIARGMPGCYGEPVVTNSSCFLIFAREAMGAAGRPAFPAPSHVEGHGSLHSSGVFTSREGGGVFKI
jgi:hypothetical protein